MSLKTNPGNYFEDFVTGATLVHAVPRTITEGDQALYVGLTGDRYPLHCSAEFARTLGYQRETVNDLLVFHMVFGKTVNDVSLNAVANLGYASVKFHLPVYPGDTVRTVSERRASAVPSAAVKEIGEPRPTSTGSVSVGPSFVGPLVACLPTARSLQPAGKPAMRDAAATHAAARRPRFAV